MLWTALGFGALLANSTIDLPIDPIYDELAATLPWLLPTIAGAAVGSAIGKLLRRQLMLTAVGIVVAFVLTLCLYIIGKTPSP